MYCIAAVLTAFGVGFNGNGNARRKKPNLHVEKMRESLEAAREVVCEQSIQCKVSHLFIPRSDARAVLVGLIDAEEERIDVTAFKLTDPEVGKALTRAHERGIKVEMVVDSGGLDTRTNQVIKLHGLGIPVYVFPDPQLELKSRFAIMHNKFFVFHHSSLTDGCIVFTGSLNPTRTSHENRENVLLLQGCEIMEPYHAEFQELKKESQLL